MLSLFPQILFLAPAGTTLLRVALAISFAYIAMFYWQERAGLAGLHIPLIGPLRLWMIVVCEIICGIIAALLLVGAWTQGVAIVAAIMILKQLIFFRKYQDVLPFSRSTYLLLLCISLMLVVTGAGAFAFDLPL